MLTESRNFYYVLSLSKLLTSKEKIACIIIIYMTILLVALYQRTIAKSPVKLP